MASNDQTKKVGIYGPTGCGKSLFVLRWVSPNIVMNEEDLKGDPFTNLYSVTIRDDHGNYITEHPPSNNVDPTEDIFIIIVNKVGWKKYYDQAIALASDKTYLVFTWKDRTSSSSLSAKILENHLECSSYKGTDVNLVKNKILEVRNRNRNRKNKKKSNDGWITK